MPSDLETRIQSELSFGLGIDDQIEQMVREAVRSVVKTVKAEAAKVAEEREYIDSDPSNTTALRAWIAAEIRAL